MARFLSIKRIIISIKQRIWWKYSLLIMCFAFLFLFSFRPRQATGTYCGEYIQASHMGFVLFCDSYQYIYLTAHPSLLLDSNFVAVRQNRPLYIYTAHVIGLPIRFITDKIISSNLFKKIGGEKHLYQESINQKLASSPFLKMYKIDDHKNLVVELLPFYIAFILMNFVILLFSLVLFERLLTRLNIQSYIIHFLSLFIVSSGIVKAFFFSAHEQMFAFFTPISIAYIIFLFLNNQLSKIQLLLISLGMGILCLAYGSFILFYPSLGIAYLIHRQSVKPSVKWIVDLLPGAILFVLPTFSWIYTCKHFSGHYFNGEIEIFREFVWVKDALLKGLPEFLYVWVNFTFRYLNTVLITLTPFLAGIYIMRKRGKHLLSTIPQLSFFQFLQWMFLLFFVFFWMLGYYNFRLTYTCVPILLTSIGMSLQFLVDKHVLETVQLQKRIRQLSVVWIIWSVLKYGPFPFQ